MFEIIIFGGIALSLVYLIYYMTSEVSKAERIYDEYNYYD